MKGEQSLFPRIQRWKHVSLLLLLVLVGPACTAPQVVRSLGGPDDDYNADMAMRPTTDANTTAAVVLARLPVVADYGWAESHPRDVQQVAYQEPIASPQPEEMNPDSHALSAPLPAPDDEVLEGAETFPLDLPTALRLAGANNLQIAFAAERVRQAVARMDQADVLWVPSINAGLVYNNHAGRLQETEGEVIEVSRNSLFVGAAAVTGFSASAGGSSGPARLVVDLPLVDVLFEPLAARRLVQAAEADQGATFNNTLLQVAVAYFNLLQAHSQVAIAQEAIKNAEELARITGDFARAGEGLQADAQRAIAELRDRQRDLLGAKEAVAVASAELVRLLRLEPAITLVPSDRQVGPIDIVDGAVPLRELIGQAIAARPENARQDALIDETCFRLRQERWRPWMPHLYAGFGGGGFGGAPGSGTGCVASHGLESRFLRARCAIPVTTFRRAAPASLKTTASVTSAPTIRRRKSTKSRNTESPIAICANT